MNAEKSYRIERGPNSATIFDACRYVYAKNVNFDIKFAIAESYTAPLDDPNCRFFPMQAKDFRIISIEHEDETGDALILRGFCRVIEDGKFEYFEFCAHYNTQTRNGNIVFSV